MSQDLRKNPPRMDYIQTPPTVADAVSDALARHAAKASAVPDGMIQRAAEIVRANFEAWGWGDPDEAEGLAEHTLAVQAALAALQAAPSPEGLREALTWVLPMAKGYAAEHPVGRNAEIVAAAEAALAGVASPAPASEGLRAPAPSCAAKHHQYVGKCPYCHAELPDHIGGVNDMVADHSPDAGNMVAALATEAAPASEREQIKKLRGALQNLVDALAENDEDGLTEFADVMVAARQALAATDPRVEGGGDDASTPASEGAKP